MAVETLPAIEVRLKLTPDDVAAMVLAGELPAGVDYELVNGVLVEVPPAFGDHGKRTVKIVAPLAVFAEKAGGDVFDSSTGFLVGRDFQQLRSPDAAYLGPRRMQPSYPRFIHGAPDLAVEVLSEGQHGEAYAISKLSEYFEAGAQLVWLVDLHRQEVRVHRHGSNEIATFRRDAVLTLDPIIPGFTLKVEDIFR